jgi:hypothetical protein
MESGVVADIASRQFSTQEETDRSFDMPGINYWTCPGCGALIELPPYISSDLLDGNSSRIDKLARSICGCWVVNLSDEGLSSMYRALMSGEGLDCPKATSRG